MVNLFNYCFVQITNTYKILQLHMSAHHLKGTGDGEMMEGGSSY